MNAIICSLLLLPVMVVVTGCTPAPGKPSAEASARAVVVDLDVVAKALGWDVVVAKRVELATENFNAQLVQAAQGMDRQLQEQKALLGDKPSSELLERYQLAEQRVQQNLRNNKALAEQAQQSVKDREVLSFRREVKPIAGRVARNRGAGVVLIANQNVLWFEPTVDITGEVIAEMRAAKARLPAAADQGAKGVNATVDAAKSGSDATNEPPAVVAE